MDNSRRGFLCALGAGALAVPSVTAEHARESWALPRGDHHNTGHASVDGPTGELGVDWSRTGEGTVTSYPAPVGGRAYVGYEDGRIVGYETATGDEAVRSQIDGTPTTAVSASSDAVFVPTTEGSVHAIDRETGRGIWDRAIDDTPYSPPMVAGDELVLGTREGSVVSLATADGSQRWTRALEGSIRTVPAVTENAVVVRGTDGLVAALDRESGDVLWRRSVAPGLGPGDFKGPAIRDGRVYVEGSTGEDGESADRHLLALDVQSGEPVWDRSVQGSVLQLVARPDRVIAFHGDSIHAHDPADGATRWTAEQDERVRLASATDVLYAVSTDDVAVYDPVDGSERDRFDPDGRFLDRIPAVGREMDLVGGPMPIDGGLLLLDGDGGLWALRGGSGGPSPVGIGGGVGLFGLAAYALYRRQR